MEKQLTLIIDKLINEIGQVQVLGDDKKVITDVTADSRVVEKGSLFICLKGATVDGHKFLKMAVEKGAVAALVEDVPEEMLKYLKYVKVGRFILEQRTSTQPFIGSTNQKFVRIHHEETK